LIPRVSALTIRIPKRADGLFWWHVRSPVIRTFMKAYPKGPTASSGERICSNKCLLRKIIISNWSAGLSSMIVRFLLF
jgi:hypothetical protein